MVVSVVRSRVSGTTDLSTPAWTVLCGEVDTRIDLSIEDGKQIYDSNCVYCHSADPTALETRPDAVTDVLRSEDIRAHRRLDFAENQIDALEKYLKSLK